MRLAASVRSAAAAEAAIAARRDAAGLAAGEGRRSPGRITPDAAGEMNS